MFEHNATHSVKINILFISYIVYFIGEHYNVNSQIISLYKTDNVIRVTKKIIKVMVIDI